MGITYSFDGLLEESIGERGVTQQEIEGLLSRFPQTASLLLQNREGFPIGWLDTKSRYGDLTLCEELAKRYIDYDVLVVVGMGGSTLGTRAVLSAFSNPIGRCTYERGGKKLIILDNVDNALLRETLFHSTGERVVLNLVSKSGTTLEVIAHASILLEELKSQNVSVVITTSIGKGPLYKLALENDYELLPIPEDVGGRYSVFTSVSFFPLLFIGLEAEAILQGAHDARAGLLLDKYWENPALRLSSLTYLLYEKRNVFGHVLMTYSEALEGFGDWWVQLIAESLGKRSVVSGSEASVGITPIKAKGPADQHSLLQLLLDGSPDKVTCFVSVASEELAFEAKVLKYFPKALEEFKFIKGKSLDEVKEAELAGTFSAVRERKRPYYSLLFPSIYGEVIGEFLLFWMVSVSLLGRFLNVNVFDEPAVELGKRYAWQKLKGI